MKHHCHAIGCKAPCAPKYLMCPPHWRQVPADLQREVLRTVKLRGPSVDASWAPWWRAQAKAIAHVGFVNEPDETRMSAAVHRRAAYLAHEMAFADMLEART